ncbi:MAG TPA: glycosyltransferase family 2 protein [Candidatus Acidoferrales bacterium]|nr:glycosyltransferase family 2 protein [Candidatus Acidoferrales bacterium]
MFCYSPGGVLDAFYILVLQQIIQGLYLLWGGFEWLRMVRRRLEIHSGFYAPRVALICPCKGLEPGLEENLASLVRFDYAEYEIFFALASGLDPARALIERVAAAGNRPWHIVVAGPPQDCGEKVNNLRKAVEKAGESFEVLVFTDSDVRLGRTWLSHLVAPLGNAALGATTTFRWYLPAGGAGKSRFASVFASAWNASILTLLGDHAHNFCWGGGTAIRRNTFEEARVLEFWKGAVSDDFAMTHALQRLGRRIEFVPECLAPTLFDTTARGLLEFTGRQMILTRVYNPGMWFWGALTHVLYCVTLLVSLYVIIARILAGDTWLALAILALVVPLLAAIKGALRTVAVEELLPDWKSRLRVWESAWFLLAPLVPFLFAWNSLVSAVTRQIRWRGIRYRLISASQTKILTR